MKITAPLTHFDEAGILPRLGADELYFSLQPSHIRQAVSRREARFANFSSYEDAALAAEIAKKRGAALSLALNKTFYTQWEMAQAKRILDGCLDFGIDAVIVADAGFLRFLRLENYHKRLEIVLSTVAAPTNAEAISFHAGFGIKRVILPRHISPETAGRYARKFPRIDFEVFIFNWHCMNLDGVCRFQHDTCEVDSQPSITQNGCCIGYEILPFEGEVPEKLAREFENVYRRSQTGCAVCSLFDFAREGIAHFKIAGRLLPSPVKAEAVRFVDDCRKMLAQAGTREKYMRLARRHYENFFGVPCSGVCYHNVRDIF